MKIFINTGLQPGENRAIMQNRFNGFIEAGQTVKTVRYLPCSQPTGLKSSVDESLPA
jgi:hypothetical protein